MGIGKAAGGVSPPEMPEPTYLSLAGRGGSGTVVVPKPSCCSRRVAVGCAAPAPPAEIKAARERMAAARMAATLPMASEGEGRIVLAGKI